MHINKRTQLQLNTFDGDAELYTVNHVHCWGPDNWQSVPVQSSSYNSEWNGTILRKG